MGTLGGSLKPFAASELAAALLQSLVRDLDPACLGGLILGQAVSAGCGPDPAGAVVRQAGLPEGFPAFTVNQGHASGLRAIIQAASDLRAGEGGLRLAGGMESSSSAPFLLPTARWGTRMGAAPILDAVLRDGQECSDMNEGTRRPASSRARSHSTHASHPLVLPHVVPGQRPGITAETGEAALDWLGASRVRHQAAQASGAFRTEVTPVTLQSPRGLITLAEDDPLPAAAGWTTFGDGAALLLLASREALGASQPLARLVAWASGRDAPEAIQRTLASAGLSLDDIDRFEVDDSLPGPLLALLPRLPAPVNALGGNLATGRPLGAAGARMVASLAHQLRDHHLRYGLAVMAAHGAGLALLLESS